MMNGSRTSEASASMVKDVLAWRCVGPFRGGRVVAVAGDPVDPRVFYFGACAGGVWKSDDGGTYWENVSDGYFKTASVGAIAVAESDPNVVYAGMGEACIRIDVTHGDGVYRSTDAGGAWEHLGLEDTRHIARVRVHPNDPDLVYVAALGHAFGPNKQRGVFRSRDGGKNWENVLFKSDIAGAADLSIDARNPRIIYASIWQARRYFWNIMSGGPDSGLYKSTDGGDTWTEITRNKGLPDGLVGRIGVAASPAKEGRVWALVEAEQGGLFLSDDGGDTWEKMNDEEEPRGRPWYYTHVFADPRDAETVWVLAGKALKSTNAGRTFSEVTMPHGDEHDLWIDPRDTQRMIEGNDGGACVTYNGGDTWSSLYNQPTSQMYSVAADDQFPYRLYGAQQDNSAISVPSRSFKGVLLWEDCHTVGLSESGKIAIKPGNPDIVYSGYPGGLLNRYDRATDQVRVIKVWPEYDNHSPIADYKYRFAWEFPIVLSPHDPDTLYAGGNIVFRTQDEGTTWEPISPDLTRNDKSKQQVSGPITADGGRAEIYCTVYAFAESPHEPGVFWAGTDDGLVHISRDGGETWNDVTPPDLPEWTMVSIIEPSPHDPATAYMAAARHKHGDYAPYLYVTQDYGATWTKITQGIPDQDFTRVIREDPARRGLLYAGTETGLYVSLNGGERWESLQLNLPVAPVYDLEVKDGDLLAATHGRSFWVLDDLTPLRELGDDAIDGPAHLLKPRNTTRLLPQSGFRGPASPGKHYMSDLLGVPATSRNKKSPTGEWDRVWIDAGTNPPDGAVVFYHLTEAPDDEVTLTILDSKDRVVRQFSTKGDDGPALTADAGFNRLLWDMRYTPPPALEGEASAGSPAGPASMGPLAAPGAYSARLTVRGDSYEQALELLKDPRSGATQTDLDEQLDLELRIRDAYKEAQDHVEGLRSLRRQVEEWERRAERHPEHERVSELAAALGEKMSAIENVIVPLRPTEGGPPRGIPIGVHGKLKELMGVVVSADWRPTRQSYEVFDKLSAQLDSGSSDLQQVIDTDLQGFMAVLRELEIPYVKQ